MGRIHGQLAQSLDFDLPGAVAHARAAADLLTEADDGIVYANALQVLAAVELLAGHPPNEAAMEEALQIERRGRGLRFGFDFGFFSVFWPLYHDDFEAARSRFREVLDAAAAYGEDSVRPNMLGHLAETECQAGRHEEALWRAAESVEIADQIGQHALAHFAEYAKALVDARVGNLEEAIARIEWLEGQIDPRVDQRGLAFFWSLRGFVALSASDIPEADRWMAAADDLLQEMGVLEPARYRFHADHVEVVVALGQLDRAEAMLERMEERARTFPRPWILAVSARCRGLILAARGDLVGAERELERALVEHERLEMPFELGRTLLVRGQVQRRRKQRRAARATLSKAFEVFEGLEARIWAGRARAELERTHVREAPEEMSPSERRVAELAATGLTNRAIADRLFLSPKTVEANLARVYRKLGIRSRAELGARMAGRPHP
jgi:DNA-binding CsgD family transcriptional regulator